ncbi:MAG: tetratricopeptide repeat protein, partial [Cyanobacteria bacterium]|nr:tetratricopeptide repeat protein [Cyanobacteriota bacterium]
ATAIERYEHAIVICDALPSNSDLIPNLLIGLATAHRAIGNYDKERHYYKRLQKFLLLRSKEGAALVAGRLANWLGSDGDRVPTCINRPFQIETERMRTLEIAMLEDDSTQIHRLSDSLMHRGQRLMALGRDAEATQDMERAANILSKNQITHKDPEMLTLRGRCLYYLKRYKEALKDFESAGGMHEMRASCYQLLGRHQEAVAAHQKLIELSGDELHKAQLKVALARLIMKEDPGGALNLVKEAQRTFSRKIKSSFQKCLYFSLSEELFSMGLKRETLDCCERVARLESTASAATSLCIGYQLLRFKEFDKARTYFDCAIRLLSRNRKTNAIQLAQAQIGLSSAHLGLGKFSESETMAKQALDTLALKPANHNETCEALEVLIELANKKGELTAVQQLRTRQQSLQKQTDD